MKKKEHRLSHRSRIWIAIAVVGALVVAAAIALVVALPRLVNTPEFRAALEHIMGPQRQIEAIAIAPTDDIERRRQDIIDAVARVDSGNGVAILTDMFGGTPSNLAISVMNAPNIEVIAGINLPMLVKLAKVREDATLAQAAAMAQEAGRKYINIASQVLDGK